MRLPLKTLPGKEGAPPVLVVFVALASLALSGCVMQPDVSATALTADGEKIEVPLTTQPVPVTDGTITIPLFRFAPWDMGKDKPKALVFNFIVEFKPGSVPTSILIEDFTEMPILQIYRDDKPKLLRNTWGAVSATFAPQDEHVKWVLTLDNNVRVYRFTIKLTDGTTHVLLKPVFVPGNMKQYMRAELGLTS
ncbi:MAG TPA: hypothetical protein VII09_10210 [Opitutaceae bacterium]